MRSSALHSSLKLHYSQPIEIASAKGSSITSTDGTEYLDCYNNVFPLGHGDPNIAEIAKKQILTSLLNTRYSHSVVNEYAEKLLKTFPEHMRDGKVFFVNSGSEANDLAIRLARAHTPAGIIATLSNSYHGTTNIVSCLSELKHYSSPNEIDGAPLFDKFMIMDIGHINDLENQYDLSNVSAVIAESIQGCGGHNVIALKELFDKVRTHSKLHRKPVCIVDEVQVGFGRSGKMWGFEWDSNCRPDIVTLGKPMGNGIPVSAVVCTKDVADSFEGEYFNTFGGNPLACAVGNHVLDMVLEKNLSQKSHDIGEYFRNRMQDESYVQEIRGKGYFIGIVFTPPIYAENVCEVLKEKYHILTGAYGPVLRLKGPLTISFDEMDRVIDSIKEIARDELKE